MSLTSGTLLGSYIIEKLIGAGGMGEVYKARDTRLDRHVALKVLSGPLAADRDRLARFVREAKALASLNHPHIVTIHSTEEAGDVRFLTMELVEGTTLDRLIPPRGLPLGEFFEIAMALADAVAAAHEKRVAHRDLKPSNVMITTDGRVKVLDFGLARLDRPDSLDADTTRLAVTIEGVVVGTVPYMSPEQIEAKPVDGRTDIFSLGVMLYEMAAGMRPFRGDSTPALMSSILRDVQEPLERIRPDIPAALARLVDRCLEKRARERIQTAGEICNQLRQVRRELPAGPPATPGRPASHVAPSAALKSETTQRGIVVLPFANVGGDPDNEYFSDGLTEEVIGDLSLVRSLKVISRSSSLRLKGTSSDPRSIGRELGVSHVLEGSVRKSGRQLRINVHLVDAETDTQIWADKYTGTMDEVFDLQERVSREIVRALDVRLTSDEDRRLAERPVHDTRVFEICLRARHEVRRATFDSVDRALAILSEGDAIAPNNVALKALRVYAEVARFKLGATIDADSVARVESLALEVFALAPESMAGNFALGYFAFERGDLQTAARHLTRAVDVEPDADALAFLSLCYAFAGHLDAAARVSSRLLGLDPLMPIGWIAASVVHWFNGEFEAGIPAIERAVVLDPQSPLIRWHRPYLKLLSGRVDEAAPDAEWMATVAPSAPYTRQLTALLAVLRGQQDEARAALAPLAAADYDHHLSFHLGEAEAMAGNTERALALLDRAVRNGFYPHDFIGRHDPFLRALHDDDRFMRIVEAARKRSAAFIE